MIAKGHILIIGSEGAITLSEDREIIDRVGYESITRFDFDEFEKEYGEVSAMIDICDIGYWYTDEDGVEQYEPPEPDFRKMIREQTQNLWEGNGY